VAKKVPHRDSPAPWKVYFAKNGALLGVGDARSGGVTDYQGGFWGSGANQRSNVHLVAAAPELYEIVEWIVEHDGDCIADHQAWLDAAHAALAKARGELTEQVPA
jgi:hypothetical protein